MFRFQSGYATVSYGKITEYIIVTIIGYDTSFCSFDNKCKCTYRLQIIYPIKRTIIPKCLLTCVCVLKP